MLSDIQARRHDTEFELKTPSRRFFVLIRPIDAPRTKKHYFSLFTEGVLKTNLTEFAEGLLYER